MSQWHVEESQIIEASAENVYAVISDYHVGHAAILPKQYFQEMQVLEGGIGAGTHIHVKMNVYGAKAEYNMVVSEPEPGRIIAETDGAKNVTTTFTVEPLSNEEQCRVTIRTIMPAAKGVAGFVERLLQPPIMRRIYRAELNQLNAYLQ